MNIIKKKFFISIIIFAIMMQISNATQIINNKEISINMNGLISNSYSLNKKKNYDTSIILSFYGKTKKNKNINTFAKLVKIIKTNINNKIKNNINTKLAYIGIKHNLLGKISYGKNYENLNKTLSYTNKILSINKSKINNIIKNINNNLITYKKKFNFKNNKILKNIIFISQYQIKNNKKYYKNNIFNNFNNGLGITYNISTKYGIDISTSYNKKIYDNKINNYNINKNILSPIKNIWSTGIKYKTNKFYLGTTYIQGKNLIKNNNYKNKNNKKITNINIVAKYNPSSKFSTFLGYVQTTLKSNILSKNTKIIDIEKYFSIGTIYKFNKSFNGYINYKIDKINNLNKKQFNNNDKLFIGFSYKF